MYCPQKHSAVCMSWALVCQGSIALENVSLCCLQGKLLFILQDAAQAFMPLSCPQNQLTASLLHHRYALWVLLLQPISQCITASCSLHLTSRTLALRRQTQPFSFCVCSGQHTSKSKIVEQVNYQMKLKVYGSIYYLSHRSFISNSKTKDYVPNRKRKWGK